MVWGIQDGCTYQGGSTDGGKMVPVAAVGPSAGRRGGGCGSRGCRWLERAWGHLWLVGVIIEVVRALEEGKVEGMPKAQRSMGPQGVPWRPSQT